MEHYLLTLASAFELTGGLLIALVVWGVHFRILKEGRIDEAVLKTVRRERIYVYVGMVLLILSFLCEFYARTKFETLF